MSIILNILSSNGLWKPQRPACKEGCDLHVCGPVIAVSSIICCLEPVLRELHRSPLRLRYRRQELFEMWNVCVRAGQVPWVTCESGSVTLSLYDCCTNGPAVSSAPLDDFYWLKWVSFRVQFWSEKNSLCEAAPESLEEAKWRQKIHRVEVQNWKAENRGTSLKERQLFDKKNFEVTIKRASKNCSSVSVKNMSSPEY